MRPGRTVCAGSALRLEDAVENPAKYLRNLLIWSLGSGHCPLGTCSGRLAVAWQKYKYGFLSRVPLFPGYAGAYVPVTGLLLRNGNTRSCGCLCIEQSKLNLDCIHNHEPNRTHGWSNSSTYRAWTAMKTRCYNPRSTDYKSYGGSGVAVCPRWQDFQTFLEDMGPRPEGKTLGRILDMGNYEPGNAFWMSPAEQGLAQRNKRALLKWQSMREASFRKPPTSVGLEQIAVA